MKRIPNYVDLNRAKRALQCFYCSDAFITFRALIQHLKTHVGDRLFLSCRNCKLRKRYAKRSELLNPKKHKCNKQSLVWQHVTRDTLANSVLHVFDHPIQSFLEEWVKTPRVRRRPSRLSLEVLPPSQPVLAPPPALAPPPVVAIKRRKKTSRFCPSVPDVNVAKPAIPVDPPETELTHEPLLSPQPKGAGKQRKSARRVEPLESAETVFAPELTPEPEGFCLFQPLVMGSKHKSSAYPEPSPSVNWSIAARRQPKRLCKRPVSAALGRAPSGPISEMLSEIFPVPPLPPLVIASDEVTRVKPGKKLLISDQPIETIVLVNPSTGPLPLFSGLDNAGGECPPPSTTKPLVCYSSSDNNDESNVETVVTMEQEPVDRNMMVALGLLDTRRVPTPVLDLGKELSPIEGLPQTDYNYMHPGITVVMPSERCELVRMDNKPFYRIPAIHVATGNMVYLLSPLEMGSPSVIFDNFTQFRAMTRPLPPFDCDWLSWTAKHRVQLISRCVSFP